MPVSLLIEPQGIEMSINEDYIDCVFLLIEPQGIEIPNVSNPRTNAQMLLIEPQGIEMS